jgi:tight adherence protein C
MQLSAPVLIALLSFGTVFGLVFVIGQYLWTQARLQRRLPAVAQQGGPANAQPSRNPLGAIVRHFDEKRFGVDEGLRGKLRRELTRAGYFRKEALNYYIFARLAIVIILPTFAYLMIEVFLIDIAWFLKLSIVAVSAFLAIIGPDAHLARRQRLLIQRYQQVFPDFLDLLVVCVDAGLSLEGALERVTPEIGRHSREFGLNLMIMEAEMRAGRSTVDALELLGDRLALDEAHSFVLVLRQSVELGSDVVDALRVFSDEMREKRMFRAEEAANKLPVKMVAPLGLFIFPVILLLIMLPLALRVMAVIH